MPKLFLSTPSTSTPSLTVERVVEGSGSGSGTKAAACIRPAAVDDVVEISYNVRLSSGT